MKRSALLVTIGIILFSVGGYFLYEKYLTKRLLDPWDLIPSNAVAVFEASACDECLESVKSSAVWNIIQQAAFYGNRQDSLKKIVSFLTDLNSGALASLHITQKDNFDFIFYRPILSQKEEKIYEQIFEEWKKKVPGSFTEREYNEVKIQELTAGKEIFSWVVLENVWVGSFTPFLLEDVIRTLGEGDRSTFRSGVSDVYQMPRIKNDAGNLYVHLTNFAGLLSVFSSEADINTIGKFGKAALLDIKTSESNFVLNGFSVNDPASPSGLSLFSEQTPAPFDLRNYVSNRTTWMTSFGISDGDKFGDRLSAYSRRSHIQDTIKQITASLKVEIDQLYGAIENEVAVCYVESGSRQLSKIMMVETIKPEIWINTLNGISEKLSRDTVFFERYSTYDIREAPLYRLPEKILWPLVTGFDQCYYTIAGQTIILGDNLEELKAFLEDIDREETWGKSVAQNKFLESTLLESNISVYVNSSRIWNVLVQTLNPKWRQFILENHSLLNSIGMGALQFSHLNESFYTNISWSYSPVNKAATAASSGSIVTSFNTSLLSKPFVVRNHADRNNEVLVQDSTYQLHLVSSKGKVLWSLALNGPVAGDVFQIDYYANGKLQYFFATPGMLHIVDRLGNYVSPFPVEIPAKAIEYVTLVDYDHSKKYRFLIADQSGGLWMYDKEGVNLEGWTPKNVDGALFTTARHHRVKGKDYIVAVRKDGKAFVINRRGETLPGFPLDLDARPAGDYYLEIGNSIAATNFVIVSREGFRIKFNLEGQIQGREALIKTSFDTHFSLIPESNGKSYVMSRQDTKQLILLDANSKEFITNTFVGTNPVNVQFFDFGAGKSFYNITDLTQDLTFVYDRQGNLLTYPPIECNLSLLKRAEGEQVKVYYTYQGALTVRSLY